MITNGVIARVATAIIVVIVVIVGGVLTVDHTITASQYLSYVAQGVGLLAIGYGLDSHSKP